MGKKKEFSRRAEYWRKQKTYRQSELQYSGYQTQPNVIQFSFSCSLTRLFHMKSLARHMRQTYRKLVKIDQKCAHFLFNSL